MKNIIGRKVGMTSVFTADGRYVPVTVIEAGPCTVLQRQDGRNGRVRVRGPGVCRRAQEWAHEALGGRYKHAGIDQQKKHIREFRRSIDGAPEVGGTVDVTVFAEGDRVDVVGISKGHGFAGGIKRHNFHGGGRTHGSMIIVSPVPTAIRMPDTRRAARAVGSLRRRSHYHQNLEVVRADVERNVLLVRGPVPARRMDSS